MNEKADDIIIEDVLKKLAIVLKQGQFHDIDNAVVISSIEVFLNLMNPLIEHDGIQKIDLIGDLFYLNNTRVKFSSKSSIILDDLAKEFVRRDLGSVAFISQLGMDDVKEFLKIFTDAAYQDDPFESLKVSLKNIQSIEVDRLKYIREEENDRRRTVIRSYFNAVSFVKGLMSKVESKENVSVKSAKRVVGTIVDALFNEEQLLFGLSAIKEFDEYTYHHSVNVSVLSISMGQRIGLKRKALVELGFAALFHDIGKTAIPSEILNKPSDFTEEEWKVMKTHPYLGALSLLRLKEPDNSIISNAIVSMEHHMSSKHSGYPEIRHPMALDVYSNIVTIADRYDAMTSSRVYQRIPLSPDEAVRKMMETSHSYDPRLLNLFIHMVGLYPAGSLVLLDSGEMGIVCESNTKYTDRPKVLIIVDRSGEKVDGFTVDLAERDQSGEYAKSILKTLDPHKYNINLAEYLLSF
ncbi:MAG: HD domain-containing protein [Nitrospiraceae bacterium]|nr:MAG: HD domain-containing protein [Nitrospiraceae bacterium]